MKTLIVAFLFVFTIYLSAQTPFSKDKLVAKSGTSQKCFITEVTKNYVTTISENNSKTKFLINTLDEIMIDELGEVYNISAGFSKSLDSIGAFLRKRNKNKSHTPNEDTNINEELTVIDENHTLFNSDKRWYFSVSYFPSKETEWNFYYYNIDPFDNYSSNIFQRRSYYLLMESQLGFNVGQNLFITLSLGYSSSKYVITRLEKEFRLSSTTISKEYENSIDKFLFQVGFKYCFGNYSINNVTPFVSLDVGKQLAFANYSKKTTYQPPKGVQRIKSNEGEFIEDINSPFFIAAGFGVEYAISKSLALSGIFKINYSSASAEYKKTNVSNGVSSNQYEITIEDKSVIYRTGLGLIFFF